MNISPTKMLTATKIPLVSVNSPELKMLDRSSRGPLGSKTVLSNIVRTVAAKRVSSSQQLIHSFLL